MIDDRVNVQSTRNIDQRLCPIDSDHLLFTTSSPTITTMPTRPPTPGPSNISSQATQPADSTPVNNSLTKKRASSEAGDDSRESKKIRKSVEIENISSSFVAVGNSKDKDKKKRKKKKRKMSVVAVEAEQQRAAVRGSTAPLSQSRSNSQLPKRTVVTAVLENVLGAIDQPHTPVPYEDGISGIEVQDDINDKEGIKPIACLSSSKLNMLI